MRVVDPIRLAPEDGDDLDPGCGDDAPGPGWIARAPTWRFPAPTTIPHRCTWQAKETGERGSN